MSKSQYQSLLFINLILCFQVPYGKIFGDFASIPWFTFLYLTGGYIRMYSIPHFLKANALLFTILLTFCFALLVLAYNYLIDNQDITELSLKSSAYNGPIYFLSILFFLIFVESSSFKGWISKILLRVAPYTLGCYLIHDNNIIRSLLWEYIFEKNQIIFSNYIILHCLSISILIFFICILIDCMREKLFVLLRINFLNDKLSLYLSKNCL